MAYYIEFENPDFPEAVVEVEDDDNVAYAYFYSGERATGFVWLYDHLNCSPNPWNAAVDRSKPATNIEGYFAAEPFLPIQDANEVEVLWRMRDGFCEAAIYIRGYLHAVVADELRPGWSRLATQDSPIAGVLFPTETM